MTAECFIESLSIHNGPSSRVDQIGGGLHQFQFRGTDELPGLIGQRQVKGDEVR